MCFFAPLSDESFNLFVLISFITNEAKSLVSFLSAQRLQSPGETVHCQTEEDGRPVPARRRMLRGHAQPDEVSRVSHQAQQ